MPEKWLVTGASGQLGGYVIRTLAQTKRDSEICALAGGGRVAPGATETLSADLADTTRVAERLCDARPTHMLHLAAMTAVGDCHRQPERAHLINVTATALLADIAERVGARFIHCSTDMVFDGQHAPYSEDSPVAPLSVYGKSKAEAERILAGRARVAVLRVPLMYGLPLTERATTFANQLGALQAGQPLKLFSDEYRTPVWLADAARALVALAESDIAGLLHLAGPERLSRYDLITRCATLLNLPDAPLERISWKTIDFPEPRPEDLSLDGSRFNALFPDAQPGPVRPEVLAAQ